MGARREEIDELLIGAYDMHVHSSPDVEKRKMSDHEILEDAEAAGMAGVLIKNHYESTGSRACLANQHFSGQAKLYGSITLNLSVGGVNPYAVEMAAKSGIRMVWMPTKDSRNSIAHAGYGNLRKREGIFVLDEKGGLKPEVYEVLEVAKQYGLSVSTGHLTTEESFQLCRAGRKQGVTMVLTHPEFSHTMISVAEQKEFLKLGAFIEKDWVDIALKMATVSQVADSIRELGAEQLYLATDRGQFSGERPVEGMQMFIEGLLSCEVRREEIRKMICDNPQRILNGESF
ncbi:DUF6282 family protein [Hominifimenecus sp. rT4P-3]|uniref:DUF6282 family protein n=1 Tax=Hominifimenecus sp. rT4P-3 TaxID=3242979 RepID=UPI003DA59173